MFNDSESRDWSWPCEWFAEAARHPHPPTAEYLESVAMGGVKGQYEYLQLREELGLEDD